MFIVPNPHSSPQRFLHTQQLNSYSVLQTISLAKSTLLLFQPSIQCMNFCRNLLTSLLARLFLIRQNLDSAVVCPVYVTDRVYSGPSLHVFEPVTEEFVKKICLSCNPKSCELNPVPTACLIDCLDVLLPHITHVMNTSLSSGHFPPIFKSAIVRPLLKKPSLDQNCLKNYRPVSNLSFLSKVLEKIVLSQLLDYLTHNHLLNTIPVSI